MLLVCVFNHGGSKVAAHQLGVIWNLASSICRSYWSLCNHNLGVPSNLGGNIFSLQILIFLCETHHILLCIYLPRYKCRHYLEDVVK
jgi:hypothetical protein